MSSSRPGLVQWVASSPLAPVVRHLYNWAHWALHDPARVRAQEARLLGPDSPLAPEERRLCAAMTRTISRRDTMYRGDLAHYYRVGLSALRCIDDAMAGAGNPDVQRILDLPCGHGRVLRFLQARFPGAAVHAVDIEAPAVDFCTRTFGVTGSLSRSDMSSLDLGGRFDLAFCGSLFTHVEARTIGVMLDFFRRHIRPGGLLVFSTHGGRAVEYMEHEPGTYKMRPGQLRALVSGYRQEGYAFQAYPSQPDYGIAVLTPDTVRRLLRECGGWREVHFGAHQWDDHQDVYGVVRAD